MLAKRKWVLAVWITFVLQAGLALAQGRTVSVRIFSETSGVVFFVDGLSYTGTVSFLWPEGSKHEVFAPSQDTDKSKYVFEGLYTNIRPDEKLVAQWATTVTADRDLTYVKIKYRVFHAVTLSFYSCRADDTNCLSFSPGRVYMSGCPTGGDPFTQSTEQYFEEGRAICLEAYPNPGYVFTGWTGLPAGTPQSNAFKCTFILKYPTDMRPLFQSARPIQVNLETSPPKLQVLADRTVVYPPVTLEWGLNTVHTLGAPASQFDQESRLWLFDSWSDGGAINHEFTMPAGQSTIAITARFVPGTLVTFLTDPPLLNLSVEGRQNWKNYTFEWREGSTHTISAPLEQVDARGLKWRFRSWSDGGAASHDITVGAPPGMRLTAIYEPIGEIRILSSPSGLAFQVDGAECRTPCSVIRQPGAAVLVEAPAGVSVAAGSRMTFQGWSDGSDRRRNLTATQQLQTLTAAYRLQHQFSLSTEPPGAAVSRIDPESPDGYYDEGTRIAIALNPGPGYRFVAWGGDLAGVRPSAVLDMSAPKVLRARLEPVPYIQPRGIQNGAAATPLEAVAPGSIISILGSTLAPWREDSTGGVLSQTLAGVTVGLEDGSLVPLAMVSDSEVRAQLPSWLPEGRHALKLKWGTMPETASTFDVVRNSPGLFFTGDGGRPLGAFFRLNGDRVTPEAPAQADEQIMLLATGAGPYKFAPPDGFIVPAGAEFPLLDPIEVISGETVWQAIDAAAAPGAVGVNAIRLRIPAEVRGNDGYLPVRVRVNGVESNTVLLPVAP